MGIFRNSRSMKVPDVLMIQECSDAIKTALFFMQKLRVNKINYYRIENVYRDTSVSMISCLNLIYVFSDRTVTMATQMILLQMFAMPRRHNLANCIIMY